MRFELYVAARYLLARRKQAFISHISLLTTLGVAVGVVALVVALALMTGLQGELRDRILGSQAHIYVWKTGGGLANYQDEIAKLRRVPGVEGAGPAIAGKALISSVRGDAFISLKGIDPVLEPNVTDIEKTMQQGDVRALAQSPEDQPAILLGRDLARTLDVRVGDEVTLMTPTGTLSPMGLIPRSRRVKVAGIYSLGLYEFDSAYGFVSLDFAKRLLAKDAPDYIQLRINDIWNAGDIAEQIPERLGSEYVSEDWQELNRSLFSALRLERTVISMTIGLIVIVAALGIISSLILLVMEKSRDIAILKTMGASPRRIMRIFMLQGLIIGLVGTTLGAIGGIALCRFLDAYKLIQLSQDVYQVSYVPFVIVPSDFAIVFASAIAISFLATIYPSRQAARLDPVQALRFE